MEPIKEEAMVATFLKAEIDSPRWRPSVLAGLQFFQSDCQIIEQPDLDNHVENEVRAQILGRYRGYGREEYLFIDFPKDVTWFRGLVTLSDLDRVRYVDCQPWRDLSGGTLLIADAALRIRQGLATAQDLVGAVDHVHRTVDSLNAGHKLPEVILVSTSPSDPKIPIEGHTRMTAYLLRASSEGIPAIVGYSSKLGRWTVRKWA